MPINHAEQDLPLLKALFLGHWSFAAEARLLCLPSTGGEVVIPRISVLVKTVLVQKEEWVKQETW